MNLHRIRTTHLGATLLCLVACSPAPNDYPSVVATGGVTSQGSGGSTTASTGGSGEAAAGTGANGFGGGATTLGGATGGVGTGGVYGSGGTVSSGGASSSGGAGTGTGGTVSSGGSSGGSPGTGGTSGGAGSGAGGAAGGSAGASDRGGAGSGTGGSGTGGAATGGANGTACPAGAFLCEGFEAYAADAAPGGTWVREVRGAGKINVENARPFAGKNALHVTGTMNADRANIRTPLVVPAETVFVRFMMYTLGYPSSSGVHTRLIRLGTNAGTPSGAPESSYSFANYNGTAIEKVNSIYLRNTDTRLNDAEVKNRWVCWEFEIDKTKGIGKVVPHIWLDGRELSLAAAGSASHGMTSTSWDPIAIETFIMGLDGFQSDSVRADFWIDDLVVHSQRVGCPTTP